MDYWAETMQDDCYLIAADGWKAETYRVIEKDKKGKEKDKGWTCDLIPKPLIVARYFAKEQDGHRRADGRAGKRQSSIAELEEEHGGEDGLLAECRNDKDKVTAALLKARRKELVDELDADFFKRYDKLEKQGGAAEAIKAEFLEAIPDFEEMFVIDDMLKLIKQRDTIADEIKKAEAALDANACAKYPNLTEADVKALVVDDKWMGRIDADIHGEMGHISQALTQRIRVLADRYETPLPEIVAHVADLGAKVEDHLKAMGFAW